jgi:putative membrane protein
MKRIQITTGLAIAALALTSTTWAAEQQTQTSQQNQQMKAGQPSQNSRSMLDRSEQEFLQAAASGNSAEIQMGKIAEQNSSDPRIRQIGSELVKDHTQANQELQRLAASKGLALNFQPTSSQQRDIQALQQKRGDDFNKAFLNQNLKAHEKTIAQFQKESQRAKDPEVRSWANKMLPGLHHHLANISNPQAVGERTTQEQTETGTSKAKSETGTTHRHHKHHTRSHHKQQPSGSPSRTGGSTESMNPSGGMASPSPAAQ